MIFLPLGRRPNLDRWASRGFPAKLLGGPRPSDDRGRYVRVVGREPPGDPLPDGPFRRVASAILDYRVFPLSVLTPVMAKTPVSVGDTVGLTYRLVPGLRMFVASRVIATFDEHTSNGWKTGFTYRTLKGHAELGEEIFAVEKDRSTGDVAASLTSWSRPGHWLTRIGYFYARTCQIHASHAALDHLEAVAKGDIAQSTLHRPCL
ncbi:MAG: DUF1990 family protein [Gemmataceae bacterium]|nr:DUF1990 family protein [Gemmataceae bacterium]